MKTTRGTSACDVLGFHDDVRAALGLPPKAKLPREGIEGRFVDTKIGPVFIWVNPFVADPRGTGRRWKSSTHRVKCFCPKCDEVMSIGRLHQHLKVHTTPQATPRVSTESPSATVQERGQL